MNKMGELKDAIKTRLAPPRELDEDLKRMEELHEDAIKEDVYSLKAAEHQKIKKGEVFRVDIPVDALLDANRNDRKLFFKKLIKDLNRQLEIIRKKKENGNVQS